MRFALVSREVYPFIGGGLSRYVTATAETLAEVGEVTIFTTSKFRKRYEELRAAGSPDLPRNVALEFVREPRERDVGDFYHRLHLWSALACEALRKYYRRQPPDLVEFPDYFGEGFVAIQARRARDAVLGESCMCIRLYTTTEMTSVLNGYVPRAHAATFLFDLERHALRWADYILAPGGDVYETYRRFYGANDVAPAIEVQHPSLAQPTELPKSKSHGDGPLELAFVGRFERRKGAANLVRAATALDSDDWRLTLVGGDTPTGPLASSMRKTLELAVAGDPRISFRGVSGPAEIAQLFATSDVAVLPSLWECWPNVVLEAFAQNCPVLATPVGGLVGMVEPRRTGWLTDGTDWRSLADALEELLGNRSTSAAVRASGRPREAFERLTARDTVREAYLEAVDRHKAARPRRARRSQAASKPLVSVVIPYFRLEGYVEETIVSVFSQTYPELEVIVVNDGSLRPEDNVVYKLAERYPLTVLTKQNSGLGAARNFGIRQSAGEYVFPLDADDIVSPEFVTRCVEVLESDRDAAYATSWVRFVSEAGEPLANRLADYAPLGNDARGLKHLNVAGSAEAVFRRAVFARGHEYSPELTSYEDWMHFKQLAEAGLFGRIIPEALLSYRVRGESMVRTIALFEHDHILGEMDARLREGEVTWTSTTA